MSDHLPECPHSNSRTVTFYGGYCVCPLLRACEQRVREDMALQYLVSDREQQEQEERAFAAGVQAARDAVAAVSVGGQHFWAVGFRDGTEQALAAIDALRGKP